MLGLLLRSGTYYLLWQKFKTQFVMILISVLLIMMILGIYNDLFSVLKISNKESILQLLLLKWFLIMFIVAVNIFMLKRVSAKSIKELIQKQEVSQPKEVKPLTPTEEMVKSKETLLTTTDLILAKYTKQKRDV